VAAAGDARLLGHRQWYVRVRTTPGAVMAIAQSIARHPDTSWVRLVSGGTEIVCSLRAGTAAGGHALLLEKLPRTSRVLDVSAQSELHVHTRNAHRLLQRVGALTTTQLRALRYDSHPTPVSGTGNAQRARTTHLDQLDLALLTVLRQDARTPVEQLAATAQTPASTTRRRLARLRASGALRIDVDVDPRALGLHEQTLLWLSVAPADLATTGAALATRWSGCAWPASPRPARLPGRGPGPVVRECPLGCRGGAGPR